VGPFGRSGYEEVSNESREDQLKLEAGKMFDGFEMKGGVKVGARKNPKNVSRRCCPRKRNALLKSWEKEGENHLINWGTKVVSEKENPL